MAKPRTTAVPLETLPKPRYGGREGQHSTDGHLPRNDSKGRPLFVTDSTHSRAVVVFDGVCRLAAERGYERAEPQRRYRSGACLAKGGHAIEVYVRETTRRQAVIGSWGRKNVYVPTGQLAFHIGEQGLPGSQWTDGRRKLEDRLGDIVAGIEAQHSHRVEWHRRCAEGERARAAEAQRAEEVRQQQEAEKARFDLLVRQVESWELSSRILAFVDEAEQRFLAVHGRIEAGSQADEWIRWARDQGERIDPLRREP